MSPILIGAIIAITLALIFYTIGVWSEHRKRELRVSHVVFFWLGLLMDMTGTTLMGELAKHALFTGTLSAHGITGVIAILLMLVHAVWATLVLGLKKEEMSKKFHRFSIFVWCVWLVPYFIGMFMGMR